MNVLFPEPEAPITARNSPLPMESEMPRSARTCTAPMPYSFCSPRVPTTGGAPLEGSTAPLCSRGRGRAVAAADDHLVAFGEPVEHFAALTVGEPDADQHRHRLSVVQLVDAAGPARRLRSKSALGSSARRSRRIARHPRTDRAPLRLRRSHPIRLHPP